MSIQCFRFRHWFVFGAVLSGCSTSSEDELGFIVEDSSALERPTPVTNFGDPLPGLSPALVARFEAGRELFSTIQQPSDGLGFAFNGVPACFICHDVPVIGGSSGIPAEHIGFLADDGSFDPLISKGGPTLQFTGMGTSGANCPDPSLIPIPLEVRPPEANVDIQRRAPPLFGLGLVEAVPDSTFEALARQQRAECDEVAGKVNHVEDAVSGRRRPGRFGLKSQIVTLTEFVSSALINELGITTPLFPHENCPQGDCTWADCDGVPDPDISAARVAKFVDFVRLMAPPPPKPLTRAARRGRMLFERIGCASCHVPTLVTGSSSIPQLDHVAFHPYSDFLVHDFGSTEGFSELTTQGEATARYVRTAPLWGAGSISSLLHDDRGGTVAGSVFWHAGEAAVARDRFEALSSNDKDAISEFVTSL
jgi:hypothetical protein